MLYLSLFAGVAFAALQTDFANVYYCPDGYCLRQKQTSSGMVGPQASFVECANAEGEAVAVGMWNYYTSQSKQLDWSNKWSNSNKDWPSTLKKDVMTYKPVGKCCTMGGKKHESWQCASYMTVGSSSSKGCCYSYGMGWNGKSYGECCQKMHSSHKGNANSMVAESMCPTDEKRSGGGEKFASGKTCTQMKASGWGQNSNQCGDGGQIFKTCASPCEPYCGQNKNQVCMTVCKQACACPNGKVESSMGSKKCIDPEDCQVKSTPAPVDDKKYNCYTKETWTSDKKSWCCKMKKIGCSYNCYTRETWSQDKKDWCCDNKKLGCSKTYNCYTRETWTTEKKEWCCTNKKAGCETKPTMAPTQMSKCAKMTKKGKCGKMDGCMWNGKCVVDTCDNKCCKAKKAKACKILGSDCIFKKMNGSKMCMMYEKPTKEQCAKIDSKKVCKKMDGCKFHRKNGCGLA